MKDLGASLDDPLTPRAIRGFLVRYQLLRRLLKARDVRFTAAELAEVLALTYEVRVLEEARPLEHRLSGYLQEVL